MKKSINIKKIVLWTSISLVFAIIVVVNVNISLNSASRSIATMLENVEALSTGESGAVATKTCYTAASGDPIRMEASIECSSQTSQSAIYPCPAEIMIIRGSSDRCVDN